MKSRSLPLQYTREIEEGEEGTVVRVSVVKTGSVMYRNNSLNIIIRQKRIQKKWCDAGD